MGETKMTTKDEIKQFNDALFQDFRYLTRDKTVALLKAAEWRVIPHKNSWGREVKQTQVMIDGTWRRLARTDLADDVRTGEAKMTKTRERLLIENEQMRFALANLLDWWNQIPNDLRGDLPTPSAVKFAIKFFGPDEK